MAFNMLLDNVDDHSKNHAFIRQESGHWTLSPAYDVLPQMVGFGNQAIPIMAGQQDTVRVAIEAAEHFGLTREESIQAC